MNTVPDHKMHHDKPMKGPLRDKKQEVAAKIPKNISRKVQMSSLERSYEKDFGKPMPDHLKKMSLRRERY